MQGRITPVLPVKVEAEDGRTIQAYARMSLYRTPMSDVRAMFYPKFDNCLSNGNILTTTLNNLCNGDRLKQRFSVGGARS